MPRALIVGAGPGFSASLARLLAREGYSVALAARDTGKLAALAAETGASLHRCDASDPAEVAALFTRPEAAEAEVVSYNASFRVRGPTVELAPEDVRRTLEVCAFGAFLVAQQAAGHMLARGAGTILLTGASAGVKGYARSAPFAMGKFALRGLGQALARELHPQGVHVVHIVVDGGIRSERRPDPGQDTLLDPDAIAAAALAAIRQPRSAWSAEIELRPWVETF
ncbi:SDR family NAD(P)-dependent oxidoreductase [Falsiroseomonas sp.]|uniref:SDR family NAD(P)-dependent oxidoreductase n=1 Tax=Falsiroseomonas sp. TaxID=2870721 RepID=UPI00273570CF|nr:SDR family NAD(P)-dependent oxidoreductase [Falsiroseomonas sp.]MDP3417039.1 SDR family NAD(P)-dependent oxidoreductase [Falsiroseomonas sp.]